MATLSDRIESVRDAITLLNADGNKLFATVSASEGQVYIYAEAPNGDYELATVVKIDG